MLGELRRIAGQCDGVRCDMAMLVLPEVFERTWGIDGRPFWPRATASGPRRVPRLPVPGRGLLGPRVDAPAAGLRLRLRQAALRPARRGRGPPGPRAPARRARLPGPPRAVPREPRRAACGRHLRAARSPRPRPSSRSLPRPALHPPGPARGPTATDPDAPRARAGGAGRGDRRLLRRLVACLGSSVPRRTGSSSTRGPRGRGTPRRRLHRVVVDRTGRAAASSP